MFKILESIDVIKIYNQYIYIDVLGNIHIVKGAFGLSWKRHYENQNSYFNLLNMFMLRQTLKKKQDI